MDLLQSFLSHLSPSRAKSPTPPTEPSDPNQTETQTPQTTPSRRPPASEVPDSSHTLSSLVPSSNLRALHTPNAFVTSSSTSASNLRPSSSSTEDKPRRKKRPETPAREKFKITAGMPPDDIINYFKEVAKLDNYTSKLIHDQPPQPSRSGGAADVYCVATVDHTHVAVKCVYVQTSVSDSKVIKRSTRELEVWSTLRHKNILPLLGLANYQGRLAMVSKWMSLGSIVDYVKDKPDEIRYNLSHQVVEAVAYLHAREIVHGDLKGENVLISDDGTPMLTDFGLTMMAESNLMLSATNAGGGTLRYMAPELFSPNGCRSKEADVYALGMTILQILTGEQPFAEIEATPVVISVVISQHRIPQRPMCLMPRSPLKNTLWGAMEKCWVYDPARRAQVAEIEALIASSFEQQDKSHWGALIITAHTPLNDVINYFESAVGLDNYTSILQHDQASLSRRGDMAQVYRVATTDDKHVAVKCTHGYYTYDVDQVTQRSARELEAWSSLKHKNILPLLGLAEYQNQLATVSPWMGLGDIVEFVNKRPDTNRYILSKQVAEAVAYLHARDIIHGDIKGKSVLMSDDGTPLLSGFGSSVIPESRLMMSFRDEDRGTLKRMAPELFEVGASRSKEADVFALGMTILEIIAGKLLFIETQPLSPHFRNTTGWNEIRRPACLFPASQLKDAFWNVMARCWARKPTQRATAAEVVDLIETALRQEEASASS